MTTAQVAGRPATIEEAVGAAAPLLRAARLPLVFGLVESTVEAQREAVSLAESLGGALDIAVTPGRRAGLLAFAEVGLVTASLGPLRANADLVVLWACDPDGRHAGFGARAFSQRAGCSRIAVDVGDASGPPTADARVTLTPAQELGALVTLRAFVRGRRVEESMAASHGLPLEGLRVLATRLKRCRYGVIVYDGDAPEEGSAPERAWALGLLARDANLRSSVRLVALRGAGNAVGAENVLTWRTGFPAAVSLVRGAPQYGPHDWNAETLLRRGDVDAVLMVGPRPWLSREALAHLERIPTVRLGSAPGGEAVFIATAPLAATAGCVFRADGIAVSRAPRAPDSDAAHALPSEASVLARMGGALGRSSREGLS